MRALNKRLLINFLFYLCLFAYFLLLAADFNYYKLSSNLDLIQFIQDGKNYASFHLPDNIHASPLYPITIQIVSKLLYFTNSTFIEIISARIISILSITLSLLFTYYILIKYISPPSSLIITMILIIHPWTKLIALGEYSEGLFTLFVLCSFWALSNKMNVLAIIISGLSYFVRNEGILLFLVIILSQISLIQLDLRKIKSQLISATILGSLIISWTILFTFNNISTSQSIHYYETSLKHGYFFFYEIQEKYHELPETRFLTHISSFLISSYRAYENKSISFLSLLLITFLLYCFKQSPKFIKGISSFVFLYLLLHSLFPAFSLRYFFPILFLCYIIFFVSLEIILKKFIYKDFYIFFTGILILLLVALNSQQFHVLHNEFSEKTKFDGYYNAINWIKEIQNNHKHDIVILADTASMYSLSFYLLSASNFVHNPVLIQHTNLSLAEQHNSEKSIYLVDLALFHNNFTIEKNLKKFLKNSTNINIYYFYNSLESDGNKYFENLPSNLLKQYTNYFYTTELYEINTSLNE